MLFWKKRKKAETPTVPPPYRQEEPSIEIVKNFSEPNSAWNGPGVVFRVKNGKGLLRKTYAINGEGDGLEFVLCEEVPLIKVHVGDYYNPTYEQMISAGYGRDRAQVLAEILREFLSEPFSDLSKALEVLKPLLGFLASGYYALVDTELYPTDGDGNFFWSVSNMPTKKSATAAFSANGDWYYIANIPNFLLPSQPPDRFDPERAEFYRDKPESRAIALGLGNFGVLLDGHHKATAAALEGRKVKTLLILTGYTIQPYEKNDFRTLIRFAERQFDIEELGVSKEEANGIFGDRKIPMARAKKIAALQDSAFDGYVWPQEILDTASAYPDYFKLACVRHAGDVSDQRLDDFFSAELPLDDFEVYCICAKLLMEKNPRFREIILWVINDYRYSEYRQLMFELLAQVREPWVEDFFIDYLVYDDGSHPHLTRIADDYLSTEEKE